MINALPSSLSNTEIYRFIELKSRIEISGQRNRCMYALRLAGLRIKDIATMTINQIVNAADLTPKRVFLSKFDSLQYELSSDVQAELTRYLLSRFQIADIKQLPLTSLFDVVFPNSKSKVRGFSPETLARLFSVTDKQIHEFAQALKAPVNSANRRFQSLFFQKDSNLATAPQTLSMSV